MSIESDMYAHLSIDGNLAPLIGTHLYPDVLPQGATLPAVVFARISTPAYNVFGTGGAIGCRPRFQYTIWCSAENEASRETITVALRTALRAFRTAHLQSVIFENERDSHEPETGLWRRDIDALLLHDGE